MVNRGHESREEEEGGGGILKRQRRQSCPNLRARSQVSLWESAAAAGVTLVGGNRKIP